MSTQDRLLQSPKLRSTARLFDDNEVGYYVPAYQRQLSWNQGNIDRFFQDIVLGIDAMTGSGNQEHETLGAGTFMGTIVCLEEGSPYSSVVHKIEDDLPKTVYVLIDGQQRVTISLLTSIVLHSHIQRSMSTLKDSNWFEQIDLGVEQDKRNNISSANNKFVVQLNRTVDALLKMLSCKDRSGDLEYYPRLIRGNDKWSTTRSECVYESSLSAILSNYIDNHSDKMSLSEYIPENGPDANKISEIVTGIQSRLELELDSTENNFNITQSATVQQALFGRIGTLEILKCLRQHIRNYDELDDQDTVNDLGTLLPIYEELASAVSFASYFLDRVMYVRMNTVSQSYAFNIFDALNSTGDPLTALEIFLPEVQRYFKATDYDSSTHKLMLDELGEYYNLKLSQEQQMLQTKELITYFALAETGKKLSNSLGEQRAYMLKHYSQSKDEEKLAFIRNLMHVGRVHIAIGTEYSEKPPFAPFVSHLLGFSPPPPETPEAGPEFEKLLNENYGRLKPSVKIYEHLGRDDVFCLRFLDDSKHRIVIPLISRFYSHALSKRGSVSMDEARGVLKSVAAFFAIWRSSRDTTDNIDTHHRNLIQHFARIGKESRNPDLEFVRNELCRLLIFNERYSLVHDDEQSGDNDEQLKGPILISQETWVGRSYSVPIFGTQRSVAKFLLLLREFLHQNGEEENLSGLPGTVIQGAVNPVDDGSEDSPDIDDRPWIYPDDIQVIQIIRADSAIARSTVHKDFLKFIGNLILLPDIAVKALNKATRLGEDSRKMFFMHFIESDDSVLKDFLSDIGVTVKNMTKLIEERRRIEKYLSRDNEILKKYYDSELEAGDDTQQWVENALEEITDRGKRVLNEVWNPLIGMLGKDRYGS